MASLAVSSIPLGITSIATSNTSSFTSIFQNSCGIPISNTHRKQVTKKAFPRKPISCKASEENDQYENHNNASNYVDDHDPNNSHNPSPKLDRRNILIGLGGLTSSAAAGLGSSPFAASAAPVAPPDISKCNHVPDDLPIGVENVDCCPPITEKFIPIYRPSPPKYIRVRRAAHEVYRDAEYIEKYSEAIRLMKALPTDDPRSFMNQANIHCAYCNGAYEQFHCSIDIQVHASWLFFPFHRWYLYFYERILGKLIGDPNFALPFWNWDAPEGMHMPMLYTNDKHSPLYDKWRSKSHQPPKTIILNFNDKSDENTPIDVQIEENLSIMNKQMFANGKTADQFLGCPLHGGEKPETGGGSIENIPHNSVHNWTGSEDRVNREDMGTFYSAGRDPIFFAHHANVDRMWYIWRTLGGKRRDFTDEDWLESGFFFYDENADPVRVYVKDCLDTTKLGYIYDPTIPLPWDQKARERAKARSATARTLRKSRLKSGNTDNNYDKFPLKLTERKKVVLHRPKNKLKRTKLEKEEEEEILEFKGIRFNRNVRVSFDVFVTDLEDDCGPKKDCGLKVSDVEYVGSYVNVPHVTESSPSKVTCLRFGLTDLLEDIKAEDKEALVVILNPTYDVSKGVVSIDNANISFLK